jgi:hypothetical protein
VLARGIGPGGGRCGTEDASGVENSGRPATPHRAAAWRSSGNGSDTGGGPATRRRAACGGR